MAGASYVINLQNNVTLTGTASKYGERLLNAEACGVVFEMLHHLRAELRFLRSEPHTEHRPKTCLQGTTGFLALYLVRVC